MTGLLKNQKIKDVTKSGAGFAMIEMLVSILILSFVMTAIFSFLWGASKYWQSGQDAADVTENARLGLNRMTRELKQAQLITDAASSAQVSFNVDFGPGTITENITYGFTQGTGGNPGYIWRAVNGGAPVRLVENVQGVKFEYFSNDYHDDDCEDPADDDDDVSYSELLLCGPNPESKIARVNVELTMGVAGDPTHTFVGQAWLRNRGS